jgi:hypothetical protein
MQTHFFMVFFTDRETGKEHRGPIVSTITAARSRRRRMASKADVAGTRIVRQETTNAPMVEVQ